ncbi:hypothetical protein QOU27_29880 [Pseudomonas aeruginosa]|nr:hypothetical protein [Pseudomonas aeruginosa]
MSEVKRYHFESFIDSYYKHRQFVLASDYDALAAKLAMAEDAAAKGDAARHQCGGMEMEIEALRAELAALRARVLVPDGYALMPLEPSPEMRLASHRYKRKNKISTGPGFWRAMAEAAPRLNGLTVSEGLLRRISDLFPADMGDDGSGRAGWFPHVRETVAELSALLNQDKENVNG